MPRVFEFTVAPTHMDGRAVLGVATGFPAVSHRRYDRCQDQPIAYLETTIPSYYHDVRPSPEIVVR
jgi:hypothetical protein